MPKRITSILIHWNQAEQCVATASRFQSLPEVASVIVVDNGSTATQLETLRAGLNDDVELIELSFNSGFGPAANRGWECWLAEEAGTEWSSIAPHDAFPSTGTIAALLDAAQTHPDAGLISADVGDGVSPVVDHVFGPISRPPTVSQGYEPVDYTHGTLMLASRTCLREIGLFDERYFAYCEEADLGLRAKAAGFDVGLVHGARVTNLHVSTPTPIVDYLKERNTVLLVREHFGRRKAALRFLITLWQWGVGTIRPSTRGDYWHRGARRQAIVDVLRRSWGPPPEHLLATTDQRD
jgi:N-acetylglucosaminyl-diphospho-decaprenol L-rhamnosyltransferase